MASPTNLLSTPASPSISGSRSPFRKRSLSCSILPSPTVSRAVSPMPLSPALQRAVPPKSPTPPLSSWGSASQLPGADLAHMPGTSPQPVRPRNSPALPQRTASLRSTSAADFMSRGRVAVEAARGGVRAALNIPVNNVRAASASPSPSPEVNSPVAAYSSPPSAAGFSRASSTASATIAGAALQLSSSPGADRDVPRFVEREGMLSRSGSTSGSGRAFNRSSSHSFRARSLSPVRKRCGETASERQVFLTERLAQAESAMLQQLESFLSALVEPRADGTQESGYIFEQLQLIARDIRHTALNNGLTGAYFHAILGSLNKVLTTGGIKLMYFAHQNRPSQLMQMCPAGDVHTSHVKRLLLIISQPARLVECLDFNPDDAMFTAAADDAEPGDGFSSGNGAAGPRPSGITTDNNHMTSYILSKLSTQFGGLLGPLAVAPDAAPKFTMPKLSATATFLAQSHGRPPVKSDFHKLKLLSQGAYGSVYLAQHRDTHEFFAMKILRKRDMANKNLASQVLAERDILQFAQNPFVIQFICSFTTRDSLYIVMEYASGGDLATYLKNVGPMPEKEARRFFAETVLAVEYIHEFGIVHRDLKPDNLIISREGHVKLTDFGLSKIGLMNRTTLLVEDTPPTLSSSNSGSTRSSATSDSFRDRGMPTENTVLGTPDYIAPEVILGQCYGPFVDWWALGIVLYEFLVGVPPFLGDTVEALFYQTLNSPVKFPDDYELSAEVKDLILQLLEKDYACRLGTPPPPSANPYDVVMNDAYYVKEHPFFAMTIEDEDAVNWDALLQEKACFVPVLDNDLDTSYFDERKDRYAHSSSSSSDSTGSDSEQQDMAGSPRAPRDGLSSALFRNFARVNLSSSASSTSGASVLPAPPLGSSLSPRRRFTVPPGLDRFGLPTLPAALTSTTPDAAAGTASSNPAITVMPAVSETNINAAMDNEPWPSASVGAGDDGIAGSAVPRRATDPFIQTFSLAPLPQSGTRRRATSPAHLSAAPSSPPTPHSRQSLRSLTDTRPAFAPLAERGGIRSARSPSPPSPRSSAPASPSPLRRSSAMSTPPGLFTQRSVSEPPRHSAGDLAQSPPQSPTRSLPPSTLSSLMETAPVTPATLASAARAPVTTPSSRTRPPALCLLGCAKCMLVTVPYSNEYGFGFTLQAMRTAAGMRNCVSLIDPRGPAAAAGVEANMAVLQVNGVDLVSAAHEKTARVIRQCAGAGQRILLHLLDVTEELRALSSIKPKPKPAERLFKRIANSIQGKGGRFVAAVGAAVAASSPRQSLAGPTGGASAAVAPGAAAVPGAATVSPRPSTAPAHIVSLSALPPELMLPPPPVSRTSSRDNSWFARAINRSGSLRSPAPVASVASAVATAASASAAPSASVDDSAAGSVSGAASSVASGAASSASGNSSPTLSSLGDSGGFGSGLMSSLRRTNSALRNSMRRRAKEPSTSPPTTPTNSTFAAGSEVPSSFGFAAGPSGSTSPNSAPLPAWSVSSPLPDVTPPPPSRGNLSPSGSGGREFSPPPPPFSLHGGLRPTSPSNSGSGSGESPSDSPNFSPRVVNRLVLLAGSPPVSPLLPAGAGVLSSPLVRAQVAAGSPLAPAAVSSASPPAADVPGAGAAPKQTSPLSGRRKSNPGVISSITSVTPGSLSDLTQPGPSAWRRSSTAPIVMGAVTAATAAIAAAAATTTTTVPEDVAPVPALASAPPRGFVDGGDVPRSRRMRGAHLPLLNPLASPLASPLPTPLQSPLHSPGSRRQSFGSAMAKVDGLTRAVAAADRDFALAAAAAAAQRTTDSGGPKWVPSAPAVQPGELQSTSRRNSPATDHDAANALQLAAAKNLAAANITVDYV